MHTKCFLNSLILILAASCWMSCEKDDTEPKNSGSGNSGGSSSGGANSIIGHWITQSGGTDVNFKSNHTGILHYTDVSGSGTCPEGSITNFTWETSNGKLTLDYTSMSICGQPRPKPDNDGSKPYSVKGNELTWAGTTWYRSGSGGGNSGGSDGGSNTGNATIWTSRDQGCGPIRVTLSGGNQGSGTITSYYSGPPECGASGCANFTLPPGTYRFNASCGEENSPDRYTWSGGFTITKGGCAMVRLD